MPSTVLICARSGGSVAQNCAAAATVSKSFRETEIGLESLERYRLFSHQPNLTISSSILRMM